MFYYYSSTELKARENPIRYIQSIINLHILYLKKNSHNHFNNKTIGVTNLDILIDYKNIRPNCAKLKGFNPKFQQNRGIKDQLLQFPIDIIVFFFTAM